VADVGGAVAGDSVVAATATGGAKAEPTCEKEVEDKGTGAEPAAGEAAKSAEVPLAMAPVAEEEEDPDADL
jgi:hypothetical protein